LRRTWCGNVGTMISRPTTSWIHTSERKSGDRAAAVGGGTTHFVVLAVKKGFYSSVRDPAGGRRLYPLRRIGSNTKGCDFMISCGRMCLHDSRFPFRQEPAVQPGGLPEVAWGERAWRADYPLKGNVLSAGTPEEVPGKVASPLRHRLRGAITYGEEFRGYSLRSTPGYLRHAPAG